MSDGNCPRYSPDLIVLPSVEANHFVLDLCSSSSSDDDDDSAQDYHDYNAVNNSRRRVRDSSSNVILYTPPVKKRKINQEDSTSAEDEDSEPSSSESSESDNEEDEDSDIDSMDDLSRLITRERVHSLSDAQSIDRSAEYIGDFDNCYMKSNQFVFGTIGGRSTHQDYRVKISVIDGNRLSGSCTCPSWYHWCKHLVALGITFIESPHQFEEMSVSENENQDLEESDEGSEENDDSDMDIYHGDRF